MSTNRHDTPPRARTLVHPGRLQPIRIRSMSSAGARHIRLLLRPGVSLFEALTVPLATNGIHSASTTILGGAFSRLQFCVAPPDPQRRTVIAYSSPIDAGDCYMIFGNATIGKDVRGAPMVHCHAAIRTQGGVVKGGHILTENTIVGPDPISVLVTSLDEFELRQVVDPETTIPVLQAHKEG